MRAQLETLADGGTVFMSVPPDPIRSPPAPYERASLIAHYLKARKPRSKLIILDAKNEFPQQQLFEKAWRELYPNLERVALSAGGKVIAVDPLAMTLTAESGKHKAQVANVIPPQKAGRIAELAGTTDSSGWCSIDPVTFESKLQPNIHVIGDAAIAGAMPKTAFAANAQAKACAFAVVKLLFGSRPAALKPEKLIDASYSLLAPDYAISMAGVYRPVGDTIALVAGAAGASPLDAPAELRVREARYAHGWFKTITEEVFG